MPDLPDRPDRPDVHPGRRRGPRGRPPWWPEDEPFPPRDGWGGRRRFVRRLLVGAGLFLLLWFVAGAVIGGFVWHGAQQPQGHRGPPYFGGILFALVLLTGGALLLRRLFRRTALPLQDVMDAADRVAAGHYDVQLREDGPPEVRQLARSFNEMTVRLGEAERRRRELLADLAHELRTPLSVIRGNAEGMLDGLYPMDRAHVDPVLEETKVMSRLLDDLRTLSTAEAGALRLHREQAEPATLVDDAVGAFRSQAEAAGVRLDARVGPGLPTVDVDPFRINEVLANLLSNALRHTPSGGSITVSADADAHGVAFTVADTGTGIPPDVLPHVFDRFAKGEGSPGAGLGLAIAKSLVEAHGGELTAESEPGRGTTMRFVLPTGRA
jgi:two-component system OmpR family sensor kinase/two-component system sensor histidine kinase BaeS